jgi:hypothetical protein
MDLYESTNEFMREPYRSFILNDVEHDPEIQELVFSYIKQRELLIDKVVELANSKGINLQKIKHDTMSNFIERHKIQESSNTKLSEFFDVNLLTTSKVAVQPS